ncbi:unnamed protein product, partial [Rotaria socialis]
MMVGGKVNVKVSLPEPKANVPDTSQRTILRLNVAPEIVIVIPAGIEIENVPDGATPPLHTAASVRSPDPIARKVIEPNPPATE